MVHQPPGVGADVQLHPEMPPVSLLRPVHLRTAGIALVPGRRRRRDDGGVNDGAPPSAGTPSLGQAISDLLKQQLRQFVAPPAGGGSAGSSSRLAPFSGLTPARRRTLSTLQACPSSPDCSDCRTAERSARAASPTADAAVVPCRRPSDTSAQCEPPGAPKGSGCPIRSREDLAALLAIAFEVSKGQLPKALRVVISRKRRGARQRARTGYTMPSPKIRLYSEVS